MNIRMMPPTQVANQTVSFNGRTYVGAPGTAQSVPDFDAAVLEANHWTRIAMTGPTSARPVDIPGTPFVKGLPGQPGTGGAPPQTLLYAGLKFFDETLGFLIEYDGATWRNPSTGAAV